jgi:hypothetical protein
MKCNEVRGLLGAYIYDDLTASEMRDLRLHVSECESCAEELHAQRNVIGMLDSEIASLDDTQRQRIAWFVKGAVERKSRERKWFSLRAYFALAATLLAGLALGTLVGSRTLWPTHKTIAFWHRPSNAAPKKHSLPFPPQSRNDATAMKPEPDKNGVPGPAENSIRRALRSLGTITNRSMDPRRFDGPGLEEKQPIWSPTLPEDHEKLEQPTRPKAEDTDGKMTD